jgi:GTP:adenosylcobinamide-phosphate guanylyltransferase
MDDNNISMVRESEHEWGHRLMRVILPHINDGIFAMFKESQDICKKSDEPEKYLITFQHILSRVSKWNNEIIQKETLRIIERSGCKYIEDLLTCVHVAHLKILTAIRTGKAQKKVEINIPKLSDFIHSAYTMISRELYTNIYLFDTSVSTLIIQQNKSKVLDIIRSCILNTIRDNVPVEHLLKAYLDETTDLIKEKEVEIPKEKEKEKELRFSDKDDAITIDNTREVIDAPKDIPTLEKIAEIRNAERKAEEAAEADEEKIKILDDDVKITFEDLSAPTEVKPEVKPEIKQDDIIDLGIEILA